MENYNFSPSEKLSLILDVRHMMKMLRHINAFIAFALLMSCQSMIKYKYVGVYEVDYRKESIDKSTAFRVIIESIAKSCNLSYKIISEDPSGKQAFFFSIDANRKMPERLVVSEDLGNTFCISISKFEAGETEDIRSLRSQIELGLRAAGCQHWMFYIQKSYGQIWNS